MRPSPCAYCCPNWHHLALTILSWLTTRAQMTPRLSPALLVPTSFMSSDADMDTLAGEVFRLPAHLEPITWYLWMGMEAMTPPIYPPCSRQSATAAPTW